MSLRPLFSLLSLALLCSKAALAATVKYNWDITWVSVNPDGEKVRPAIGINGVWPCPAIHADVGDTVLIHVNNQLGNETTSIHFHGLYQQGTNSMDGPVGVTQCPIPPGGRFTYEFQIQQPGTYWYHSHDGGQYPDGFRGPLIVHDPASPYLGQYDEEYVLTLTDWYHEEMPILLNRYLSAEKNPSGDEPVPYSNLINEAQNVQFNIQPGKTYFFRIINMAAFATNLLQFDQHDLTIIEIDGVYVEKKTVGAITVAAAQRYGVLVKAKPTASKNFAMLAMFDLNMFNEPFIQTPQLNPNVTGYLMYNDNYSSLPAELSLQDFRVDYDDFDLIPVDREPLLRDPDTIITFDFSFTQIDGQNRAIMNNITYIPQIVPSLYTAMTTGHNARNPVVYGVNSNPHVLDYNSIVEIRLNNYDNGGHPFHLHGHQFQAVARSAAGAGSYDGDDSSFPPIPMRRDTFQVLAGGYIVLRFRANNPGVFLFHCHIEWHVEAGLIATMIEAPIHLQQQQTIPSAQIATCKNDGVPTRGNAAGNIVNFLNLTGANTTPPLNPMGALINSTRNANK